MQWRTNGTGILDGGRRGPAAPPSTTVTGLTNNTSYEFQVRGHAPAAAPAAWTASALAHTAAVGAGQRRVPAHLRGDRVRAGLLLGAQRRTASSATAPTASTAWYPVPVDTTTGLTTRRGEHQRRRRDLARHSAHTCAVTTTGAARTAGATTTTGSSGTTRTGTDRLTPTPVRHHHRARDGSTSPGDRLGNELSHVRGDAPPGGPTAGATTSGGQLGDTTIGTNWLTTPRAVDTTTGLTTTNVASITRRRHAHLRRHDRRGRPTAGGADANGETGRRHVGASNRVTPTRRRHQRPGSPRPTSRRSARAGRTPAR